MGKPCYPRTSKDSTDPRSRCLMTPGIPEWLDLGILIQAPRLIMPVQDLGRDTGARLCGFSGNGAEGPTAISGTTPSGSVGANEIQVETLPFNDMSMQ